MSEWYLDFVDLGYKPHKDDLICLFRVEPAKGFSMKEAAGRVASESSCGTWTELVYLPKRVNSLMAKAFEIKRNYVKVAYPIDLWELGNMPQILSGIAGNIFGMKAVKNLRLEDVQWPYKLIKSFKGPQFGVRGIRKMFKIFDRPLTATVPKPKLGLNTEEYCNAAYQIWKGGIDFLKMDENMTSQKFVNFYKTVKKILQIRNKVENETGERKMFLANVSAETKEMIKRTKFVHNNGGEIVMADILTVGWSGLQTLRNVCRDLGLALYAHRAFHSAFSRNPKHGMSMIVIAEISRILGVDAIHIGGMGKLISPKEEVFILKEKLEKKVVKEQKLILSQNWYDIEPIFGVTSGGLHAGIIPRLIKLLGKDIIIQAGGGVTGHPNGFVSGAKSIRQSIDATLKGISLKDYSKTHEELKEALDKWGYSTPK